MPIKHLRAALRRYRPYFIVRVTGALTLCLTLALVLIMATRVVAPAYGCITLTTGDPSQGYTSSDSSLYDLSSGRYFNSQQADKLPANQPETHGSNFGNSPDNSFTAYMEYVVSTQTANLVVISTNRRPLLVLRQPFELLDTPYYRLYQWSHGSRWIVYQVPVDSTHIQYKLAEVVPPYRIETVPQLLMVKPIKHRTY